MKILLTTRNVREDSGHYATKYYFLPAISMIGVSVFSVAIGVLVFSPLVVFVPVYSVIIGVLVSGLAFVVVVLVVIDVVVVIVVVVVVVVVVVGAIVVVTKI